MSLPPSPLPRSADSARQGRALIAVSRNPPVLERPHPGADRRVASAHRAGAGRRGWTAFRCFSCSSCPSPTRCLLIALMVMLTRAHGESVAALWLGGPAGRARSSGRRAAGSGRVFHGRDAVERSAARRALAAQRADESARAARRDARPGRHLRHRRDLRRRRERRAAAGLSPAPVHATLAAPPSASSCSASPSASVTSSRAGTR